MGSALEKASAEVWVRESVTESGWVLGLGSALEKASAEVRVRESVTESGWVLGLELELG